MIKIIPDPPDWIMVEFDGVRELDMTEDTGRELMEALRTYYEKLDRDRWAEVLTRKPESDTI